MYNNKAEIKSNSTPGQKNPALPHRAEQGRLS